MAETKDRAEKAFDFFLEAYGAKYDKATACLAKDRAVALLRLPGRALEARTTNAATVRLRTIKTKGCLSRTTALTMVFKWPVGSQEVAGSRRSHRLAEIVEGVKFRTEKSRTRRLKTTVTNF